MQTEKPPQIENLDKITLKSFAELVKQMRHNQKRYFAFRKPETLITCKELEQQVDAIVAQLTDTQLKLFD